jgi:adenylate cyclase
VPANATDTAQSLQNISALVAAPILNGAGEVIGALYGDRRSGGPADDIPDITMFEAKLVEVLASGIAAGLARVKEEKAAIAARVQFEQFFTPQLAVQLERDPKLLDGRDYARVCRHPWLQPNQRGAGPRGDDDLDSRHDGRAVGMCAGM